MGTPAAVIVGEDGALVGKLVTILDADVAVRVLEEDVRFVGTQHCASDDGVTGAIGSDNDVEHSLTTEEGRHVLRIFEC